MRFLCIAILIGLPICLLGQEKPKEKFTLSEDEQGVLDRTNAERKAAGFGPLKASPKLFQAARAHSENMANQSKLEHELDGKRVADRVRALRYSYKMCGENIAWNSQNPEQVVKCWMDSPGHRANLLMKDYTEIGIGVAKNDKGEPYWTQVFGRPR